MNIVTLTKAYKDQITVNEQSESIEAIPNSPIPAFIIKNKNVEKIVYIKDNKAYTQTLSKGASPFIYTYMADRHILLQVSSPAQVSYLLLLCKQKTREWFTLNDVVLLLELKYFKLLCYQIKRSFIQHW